MEDQKRPADEPEVVNPRYAGATFGDVARALAKQRERDRDDEDDEVVDLTT